MGNLATIFPKEPSPLLDLKIDVFWSVIVDDGLGRFNDVLYLNGKMEGDYLHVNKSVNASVILDRKNEHNFNFRLNKLEIHNYENYFPMTPNYFFAKEVTFIMDLRGISYIYFPDCFYNCKKIILDFNSAFSICLYIFNENCPVDIEIRIYGTRKLQDCYFYVTNRNKIEILRDVEVKRLIIEKPWNGVQSIHQTVINAARDKYRR